MHRTTARRLTVITVAVCGGSLLAATGTAQAAPRATGPTGLVLRRPVAGGTVSPQASVSLSDGIRSFGSSSKGNNISNSFSTRVQVANAGTYLLVQSGTSTSHWTGSASGSTTLHTHMWATGLSLSASAGSGGSVSGSVVNLAVDYSASGSSRTGISDTVGGDEWTGVLFSFNENVTASWTVAGRHYSWTTN